jgi:lipoprotein signal peptidase
MYTIHLFFNEGHGGNTTEYKSFFILTISTMICLHVKCRFWIYKEKVKSHISSLILNYSSDNDIVFSVTKNNRNYSSGLHRVHYIYIYIYIYIRKKKDLQHIIPLFFIFYLKRKQGPLRDGGCVRASQGLLNLPCGKSCHSILMRPRKLPRNYHS